MIPSDINWATCFEQDVSGKDVGLSGNQILVSIGIVLHQIKALRAAAFFSPPIWPALATVGLYARLVQVA